MANFVPAFMLNYTSGRVACSSAHTTAASGLVTRGISMAAGKASCSPSTGVLMRCAMAISDSVPHPPSIALIVRAAQAAIAIGGGWGTLSEIAMAQRIKTPVVGLHDAFPAAIDSPRVTSPEAAVVWALEQAARPEV